MKPASGMESQISTIRTNLISRHGDLRRCLVFFCCFLGVDLALLFALFGGDLLRAGLLALAMVGAAGFRRPD
jgi:hypothetical protein